jgi:hypothetical protein
MLDLFFSWLNSATVQCHYSNKSNMLVLHGAGLADARSRVQAGVDEVGDLGFVHSILLG